MNTIPQLPDAEVLHFQSRLQELLGQTPEWLPLADRRDTLSAQPGAPYDCSRADKVAHAVSKCHSAEGVRKRRRRKRKRSTNPPRVSFDGAKKLQAVALLAAGVSHRRAAAFLGLSATAISQGLRRDRQFARQVAVAMQAMSQLRVGNSIAVQNSIKLSAFPPGLPPRSPP